MQLAQGKAAPSFPGVTQGPLDVAHAVQAGVPGEVGVAEDVGAGAHLLDAGRQAGAASRFRKVGQEQHALLRQQLLRVAQRRHLSPVLLRRS